MKAYLAESVKELYERLGLIESLLKIKWLRMKEVDFPKFQSDSQAVFLVRSMKRGFKDQPAEIIAKSLNAYQKDSIPFIQVVSAKGVEFVVKSYENDAYLDAVLLYAPKEIAKKGTHAKLL